MKTACTLLFALCFHMFASAQLEPEIIGFSDAEDVPLLRNEIIDAIWPSNKQSDSAKIEDFVRAKTRAQLLQENYPWEESISSIDKFTIVLKNSVKSRVFVLHPKIKNRLNVTIIYHGGHNGGFWEDKWQNEISMQQSSSILAFFLDRGFDIACLDMPLVGMNQDRYIISKPEGTYIVEDHNGFFSLKEPFYYFLEPIKQTLDFLENNYGYSNFAMMGLSGGGWTTTLYSALDTRIKQSYAIAGSVPIQSRTLARDWGDTEQNYEEFYSQYNYSTLYTLAAAGKNRLHFQILNKKDQCCFALDGSDWVPNIELKMKGLNDFGEYKFYLDTFAIDHRISQVALDTIYSNLANGLILSNISLNVELYNNPKEKKAYLCTNDSLYLTSTMSRRDSIQWYKDNESIKNATGRFLQYSNLGSYYARVTNVSGISFYSDTVMIIPYPTPVITKSGDKLISSIHGLHKWFLNNREMPGLNNDWIKPGHPGNYSAIAISENCVSNPSIPFTLGTVIYPNPVYAEFNLNTEVTDGPAIAELIDLNGKIVLKHQIVRSNTKINLPNNLVPGVYILNLHKALGLNEVHKILVR